MTPPSPPPTPAPDDGDDPLDVELAQALAALDAGPDDGPSPDAGTIAAHLAGPGAENVLSAAARSPRVRALLGDVVVATRDASPEPLSDALRERLLALGPAPVARAPRRGVVLPLRRIAAAAAVLVAASAAFVAISARVEAGPAVAVEGIERVGPSGTLVSEGAAALALGSRIAPAEDERVAIHLPGGSRIVLGGDDALRVARDPSRDGAAFALDGGRAAVAAGPGAPVLLLLAGGGRLEVVEGAARVDAGAAPSLALDHGARARFTARVGDRDASRTISGPASVRLSPAGPSSDVSDRPASDPQDPDPEGLDVEARLASLRRDLEFFGGAPRTASPERVVSSRRFRILDAGAPGRARSSDAAGVPAIRLDLVPVDGKAEPVDGKVGRGDGARTEASIAWRADPTVARVRRVEASVRVRGPEGRPATLRVRLTAGSAPPTETVVSVTDPKVATRVPLDLPSQEWEGDLVLSFEAVDGPAVVWFEGLAFGGAPPPRSTMPPASTNPESRVPEDGVPSVPGAEAGPR